MFDMLDISKPPPDWAAPLAFLVISILGIVIGNIWSRIYRKFFESPEKIQEEKKRRIEAKVMAARAIQDAIFAQNISMEHRRREEAREEERRLEEIERERARKLVEAEKRAWLIKGEEVRLQDERARAERERQIKKELAEEASEEGKDTCQHCYAIEPERCSDCGACLHCTSSNGDMCYPCWSSAND